MGIMAKCYKIFLNKDLSIFNLFYDNLIFKIWAFKSLFFQQLKDFLQKLHTWYTQNLIIKSLEIVLSLPQKVSLYA
jgi:hypothetical protein